MSASVNRVILMGNLGRDPEMRKTPSGASVVNFSLATTEKYTDKQGQRQESVEWHNIVAWNKSAENMAQYLKKGSSVYIEGKLSTKSWEDNGQKKYRTEVNVQHFQFVGGQPQQQGQQQGGFQQAPQQQGGFPQQPPMQPQQGVFPQQQQDELPF